MAIIPSTAKVLNQYDNVNTTYGGSAAMKAQSKWYTMQDVIDTVNFSTGLSPDELAALNGANNPSAANVFATIGDLTNELTPDQLNAIQDANAPSAVNPFATLADVGGGIEGSSYLYVTGNGTATENFAELTNAVVAAGAAAPYGQPLSATNRFRIIVGPGTYDDGFNVLTVYDQYVDIYSLTGECDVILPQGIGVYTGNININGIDTVSSQFTILDSLSYLNISNCKAGDYSFGRTDIPGTTISLTDSTFTNCIAGNYSFGGELLLCTFTNCTAGDYSFGYSLDITANIESSNNTFENCSATNASFLVASGASGNVFFNTNTFLNCTATNTTFCNAYTIGNFYVGGNIFRGCTSGGNGSFINCASQQLESNANEFYNCSSGKDSFIKWYNNSTLSQGIFSITTNIFEGCSGTRQSFIRITSAGSATFNDMVFGTIVSNSFRECSVFNGSSCFITASSVGPTQIQNNILLNCVAYGDYSFIYVENSNNGDINIGSNEITGCISGAYSYICNNLVENATVYSNVFNNCTSGFDFSSGAGSSSGQSSFMYATGVSNFTADSNSFNYCKSNADNSFISLEAFNSGTPVNAFFVSGNKFRYCDVTGGTSFIYLDGIDPNNFSEFSPTTFSGNKFDYCKSTKQDCFIAAYNLWTTDINSNTFNYCKTEGGNSFVYMVGIGNSLSVGSQRFEYCTASYNSFVSAQTDNSFGVNGCIFKNCSSGGNSFASNNGFSSSVFYGSCTFENCVGGSNSFACGLFNSFASNVIFSNCKGNSDCFVAEPATTTGATWNGGSAVNCYGGSGSFGVQSTSNITASLYYCKSGGTLPTIDVPAVSRYCLDGSNVPNNQN